MSEAGYAPCVRLPRKHPASMEAALHVLEIAVGILVVAATLGSAIKTVVITRSCSRRLRSACSCWPC